MFVIQCLQSNYHDAYLYAWIYLEFLHWEGISTWRICWFGSVLRAWVILTEGRLGIAEGTVPDILGVPAEVVVHAAAEVELIPSEISPRHTGLTRCCRRDIFSFTWKTEMATWNPAKTHFDHNMDFVWSILYIVELIISLTKARTFYQNCCCHLNKECQMNTFSLVAWKT